MRWRDALAAHLRRLLWRERAIVRRDRLALELVPPEVRQAELLAECGERELEAERGERTRRTWLGRDRRSW